MIESLTRPFIPQLKSILPASSWKWIIPALRRDTIVWHSLANYQTVLGVESLKELIHKPEDCSPSYLALSLIKYPETPTELRTLPLIPVNSSFRESVEAIETSPIESLRDAALMALYLRQKRIETGSWNDWADLLRQSSPTALTCLFGIIPDQIDLLSVLVPDENAQSHSVYDQEKQYDLILHILLSNPIPPASLVEYLKVIFKSLSPSQQQIMHRRILSDPFLVEVITPAGLLPVKETSIDIQSAKKTLPNGSSPNANEDSRAFNILNFDDSYSQLSIFDEQSDQQIQNLEQTIEKTYDIQAGMLAKMAVISMIKGDINAGIQKFNQARLLRPASISLTCAYILSLFHTDDFPKSLQENSEILYQFSTSSSPLKKFIFELSRKHIPNLSLGTEKTTELNKLAVQAVQEVISLRDDTYLQDPEITLFLLVELSSLSVQLGYWHVIHLAMQEIVKQYPQQIPAMLLLAYSLNMQGDHESALNLLHYVECLITPNSQFNQYLAQNFAANGQWQDSYRIWRTLQSNSLDPSLNHNILFETVAAALQCGELSVAQEVCREMLKQAPDNGIALALFTDSSSDLPNETREEKYSQAIQSSPEHPYPWLAKYRFLRCIDDHQSALTTLKSAILTLPNCVEIQLALGDFYLEEGTPSLALPHLQAAATEMENTVFVPYKIDLRDVISRVNKLPSFLESLNLRFSMDYGSSLFSFDQLNCHIASQLGKTLLMLGHTDSAQIYLEKIVQSYPYNPDLTYQLAKAYMTQGKFLEAGKLLKSSVIPKSQSVEARLDFVHCAEKEPSLATIDETILALQQAIELEPNHFEALVLLAEVLIKADSPQHALELYEQIMKFPQAEDTDWKDRIRINMSQAAIQTDKYELALATLLECNNQNPMVLRQQAEIYLRLGLPEEALRCAQGSLEGDQQDTECLSWYASFLLELANQSKDPIATQLTAIKALESAIEIAPSRFDLRLKLADIYRRLGDNANALNVLQYFILPGDDDQYPEINPSILAQAANYLAQLENVEGAVSAYQRALELEKNSESPQSALLLEIFTSLSAIYKEQGKLELAIDYLEKALQISPAYPDLTLNLADAYFSTKSGIDGLLDQHDTLRDLIQHVNLSLQTNPGNWDIALLSSFLHRLTGNRKQAVHILQSLLKSVENNDANQKNHNVSTDYLALLYVNLFQLLKADLSDQLAAGFLEEGVEKLLPQLEIEQGKGIELVCEWCEHNLQSNPNILSQVEKLFELSPENTRLQSIAARIKSQQGDIKSATHLFENALVPQNWATIRVLSRFSPPVDKIFSWFQSIETMNSLARAAQELGQWNIALELINQILKVVPTELSFHYERIKTIIRRAEFQAVCEQLDIIYHAPGNGVLNDEIHHQFEESLKVIKESLHDLPTDSVHLVDELKKLVIRAKRLFPQSSTIEEPYELPDSDAPLIASKIMYLQTHSPEQDFLSFANPLKNDPYVLFHAALGYSHNKPNIAYQIVNEISGVKLSREYMDKIRQSTWLVHPYLLNSFLLALKANLCDKLYQSSHDENQINILEGLSAIQSALDTYPDEPRWYALASKLAILSNQPQSTQQAIEFLETASRLEPNNLVHLLQLSRLYMDASRYESAIKVLENALQLEPENLEILYKMAQAYYQIHQWEEASFYADTAIRLQPLHEETLILRGEIALKLNDIPTAIQYAEQALEQPTNNPSAWSLLARALHYSGKTEDALRIYEQAIPVKPKYINLLIEKLSLLKQINGLDCVISEIQSLMREIPDSIELNIAYTEALMEKGMLDEAIANAQSGLRYCHQSEKNVTLHHHAHCHQLLGELMKSKGHLDQAVYHFSEASQLDPNNEKIQILLGDTYTDRGDIDKALSNYLHAAKLLPNDPTAYFKAGVLYKEIKDYPNAEQMLRQAARLDPENLIVQRQLGAVVALNLLHNRKKTEVETT